METFLTQKKQRIALIEQFVAFLNKTFLITLNGFVSWEGKESNVNRQIRKQKIVMLFNKLRSNDDFREFLLANDFINRLFIRIRKGNLQTLIVLIKYLSKIK